MAKLTKVEVVSFNGEICLKESKLKSGGTWQYADRVCENFKDIETAQFVAKAINQALKKTIK